MTTATRTPRQAAPTAPTTEKLRDPGFAAFSLLRMGFTVAPILFGIDKFFDWMVEWERYLWVGFENFFPGNANQIMYGVGAIEIFAGLMVMLAPRIGGTLVAAWLAAIVTNLVIVGIAEGEYWDIALRDFGLFMGAVTLVLLSLRYGPLARRHQPGGDGRTAA